MFTPRLTEARLQQVISSLLDTGLPVAEKRWKTAAGFPNLEWLMRWLRVTM
jgi:hypothetical protein